MAKTTSEILEEILKRVIVIERATCSPSKSPQQDTTTESVLKERLGRLTIKRHAVLTASLAEVGYQEIAELMQCDVTTVKLHLKAALQILGITSRSILLTSNRDMLKPISDREYERLYGLGKRWWLDQKPSVMSVLTSTKASSNQYTKALNEH